MASKKICRSHQLAPPLFFLNDDICQCFHWNMLGGKQFSSLIFPTLESDIETPVGRKPGSIKGLSTVGEHYAARRNNWKLTIVLYISIQVWRLSISNLKYFWIFTISYLIVRWIKIIPTILCVVLKCVLPKIDKTGKLQSLIFH